MTDALVSLPPHLRRRLEGALDTGLVSTSSTPATVRSVLGLRDGAEDLLADLNVLERTVWASTYAYFDGPRTFAALANRIDAIPDLQVTLLLNIQRRRGDTTAADQLVRRFAD